MNGDVKFFPSPPRIVNLKFSLPMKIEETWVTISSD